MKSFIKAALGTVVLIAATQATAQVTFYEHEGFQGRALPLNRSLDNFQHANFNDLASSVVVERGAWEVCEHAFFEGRCMILRRGAYHSLVELGANDRISSARPVDDRGRPIIERSPAPPPPPPPSPGYDYSRRPNERLFEANVIAVRAVMGPPEQRCWVERQQVVEQGQPQQNAGGAVVGAIIGGILGHQVGRGQGKDVATATGAIAGAVVGANAGATRNDRVVERDVRRCENVPGNGRPAYWDVTYEFRGVQHQAQMTSPPGATILVNRYGEPRQ